MKHTAIPFIICLALGFQCSLLMFTLAHPMDKPVTAASIVIDAAPSVVSYQGSSQAHARLVLAPMGRALGYVEPVDVNRTVAHAERLDERFGVLDITPIYVHQ